MKSTISETTLRQMEADAAGMKAELHVGNHVRALIEEVRRLTVGGPNPRPDVETARTALAVLTNNVTVGTVSSALLEQSAAVLKAYLAPYVPDGK